VKRIPAASGANRPALRVTRHFGVPPERVFDAWLDAEVTGRWLFATASRAMARTEIDARVGGSFRFVDRRGDGIVEHTGEYLELDPPRRLVFTLSLERHPQVITRVAVEIVPSRYGCALTLAHEGVPRDRAGDTAARWRGILYGLGETLEALAPAVDFRQRRPTALRPTAAYRSAP